MRRPEGVVPAPDTVVWSFSVPKMEISSIAVLW
jgi:hypothetical protein